MTETVKTEEVKKHDGPAVVFYCKDCEELVDTNQIGKKYVYTCKKCNTKNVAFGTAKSVNGFFRLEEKAKQKAKEAQRIKEAGKSSEGQAA